MRTYWGFLDGEFKAQFEAPNFDVAMETFKSWFEFYGKMGLVSDYFIVDIGG